MMEKTSEGEEKVMMKDEILLFRNILIDLGKLCNYSKVISLQRSLTSKIKIL
jgi:hypothetical protein